MKRLKIFFIQILLFSWIVFTFNANAQNNHNREQTLNPKQQSIIPISAFAAKGDMLQLRSALNEGLDAGLSVNEIKEILVQLYAYTGFPRSLNALNTFKTVLDERKIAGITDQEGKVANSIPTNKTRFQLGTDIQTQLVGQPVKGSIYDFAPVIDQFLKEHLFADIFGRDNLDFKPREIATISALSTLDGVENQIRSHLHLGLHNGLSESQLYNLVAILKLKVGEKESNVTNKILQTILNGTQVKAIESTVSTIKMEVIPEQIRSVIPNTVSIFSKGERITNSNFVGCVWFSPLIAADSINKTQVGNVTFAPGARTNWHYHPCGQILLVIGGVGYYQEKGNPVRVLKKGDVVKCPPNILHWHGASPDSEFIQVAITNSLNGPTVWLKSVTDEEYNKQEK